MSDHNAKPFTIKRITKTTDKFAAVCYIYEGQHFQDLCRIENPDGTFNFSEKCLAQLPYHSHFSDASDDPYSATNGSSNPSSLAPYRAQANAIAPYEHRQSDTSFIAQNWPQILITLNFLFFLIAMVVLPIIMRKRSRSETAVYHDENGNVSIGKIKFHQDSELGTGSKGTYVFRGTFENSQDCAIKRIVAQTITLVDREIEFLRSLQHPNLVRYLATESDRQFVYIALELADCTLRSLVEGNKFADFGLSKEEVCKQSAMGLQHLHKLKIVHRDLKPENILVSLPKRPNNERYIMITDFGLSKQLTNAETYHSSNAMRYFDGTQGWMPPEIIEAKSANKNLMPKESADIFSLGCVFHYVIFNGKHPFGSEPNEREQNIRANRSEIDRFATMNGNKENESTDRVGKELEPMAIDLISYMISHDDSKRPPIDTVLKYPLFWSKKQSLLFISEVSDRLDYNKKDTLGNRMEYKRSQVFGYGWKKELSETLLTELKGDTRRGYNEKSMQHLLRLIRNKSNHYNDCSAELKRDLGHPPDEFYTYFSTRFPELIIHVYKVMQDVKTEMKFREYYAQDDDFTFDSGSEKE